MNNGAWLYLLQMRLIICQGPSVTQSFDVVICSTTITGFYFSALRKLIFLSGFTICFWDFVYYLMYYFYYSLFYDDAFEPQCDDLQLSWGCPWINGYFWYNFCTCNLCSNYFKFFAWSISCSSCCRWFFWFLMLSTTRFWYSRSVLMMLLGATL